MSRKRRNSLLARLVLLSFLIALASGCDKYTRHDVLTFFFTGVPPIEEEEVQVAETVKEKTATIAEYSTHGPYAARQCYQCHRMSAAFGFRNSIEEKGGGPGLAEQMPGLLVMPPKDLCVECHTLKPAVSAYNDSNLWVHGPVADGDCTKCHSPHRSPSQYMLLKEKSTELCTQCHTDGYMSAIEEHKEEKECNLCHNPHFGKNRFLVKKDFNEIF